MCVCVCVCSCLARTQVTTKDGIGARLDVIIYHYISDPTINVLRVANTSNALSSLARDSLGTVVADMKQKDLFGQSPIGEQVQVRSDGLCRKLHENVPMEATAVLSKYTFVCRAKWLEQQSSWGSLWSGLKCEAQCSCFVVQNNKISL